MARIISGNRTAEDLIRLHLQRLQEETQEQKKKPKTGKKKPASTVVSNGDYITLENISCVDADGSVFEKHDKLYIAKDVVRGGTSHVSFTPYNAVAHFEQQSNGLFLPSFALTCSILVALYRNRNDAEVNKVLMQYKNHGAGYGYQAQNTVINYTAQEVIHYPLATNFSQSTAVNAGHQTKRVNFVKATLQDSLLENMFSDPAGTRFVKQLTGLADPAVLVEIGKHFGNPAKVWFPWNGQTGARYTGTHATWFGCDNANLNLDASNYLNNVIAARGVRSGAP